MANYGNVRAVSRAVAVSGIGVVSPFGTTQQSFVDNLLQGRSAIAPLAGFDTGDCAATLAAQATTFRPSDWLPPMRLRRLERTGVYAAAVARLAFDDAARPPMPEGDDRAGVVLGTWTAGGESSESYLEAFFTGGPQMAPALLFESTVGNAPASFVALEHKLRGPNATISHREASGIVALASAVEMLRLGRASRLLAGGVDVIFETFYRACDRFGIMSPAATFSPAVAPFDRARGGFVLGEGGAALWLESSAAAPRASTGQHGWIIGAAESSTAVPLNTWPSSPEPLVRTMLGALDDAGLRPADVHVVYASANATRDLDRVEAEALTHLFAGSGTIVTSIKGAVGEAGVSGATACAAALLCGRHGQVPPIAGLVRPDAVADRLNLARAATPAPGPIALVNGFASGGTLCSLVVRVRTPA
ncbi:MAG: beta-ketoacyl synthase [Vicinamibacterales bacterium]